MCLEIATVLSYRKDCLLKMPESFQSFILGVLVLVTILGASGAPVSYEVPEGCPCTDIAPPGVYSCMDQKNFGKCDQEWMKTSGFCEFTCGRCSCDGMPAAMDHGSSGCPCVDVPPGDDFSCEEQKRFGKCERLWMKGYCQITCGTCSCPSSSGEADESVALEATSEKVENLEAVSSGQESFTTIEDVGGESTETPTAAANGGAASSGGTQEEEQARDDEMADKEETASTGDSGEQIEPTPQSGDSNSSSTLEDIQKLPKEIQDVLIRLDKGNGMGEPNPAIQQPTDCETVWRAIETRPDLSLLKEAIENGQLYQAVSDPNLEVTMLAPNNEGFMEFKSKLGDRADELLRDSDFLQAMISYHTILPPMRLEDMEEGRKLSTLAILKDSPESLVVSAVSGDQVTIEGDNGSGKTTEGNIEACKSVVHVIDTVLISNKIEELMQSFDLDIQ